MVNMKGIIMQISHITGYSPKFGIIECTGYKDNPEQKKICHICKTGANISNSDYPVNVSATFHKNGHIASIDVDYMNNDSSFKSMVSGHVHEEYDENGKNINIQG